MNPVDAPSAEVRDRATERLAGLVKALVADRSLTDPEVLALRYQLLSGAAGAIAAAVERQGSAAVFFIHEFVTDNTTDTLRQRKARDLHNLGSTAFGCEFPLAATSPWCEGPLPYAGDAGRLAASVELYVAKATSDWRTSHAAVRELGCLPQVQ